MKVSSIITTVSLISVMLMLPGCRYKTWLYESFYPGEEVKNNICEMSQYVRSLHIYDQFETLAHFDALWLADEVRENFASIYACKNCFSEERYRSFLRRQLEENKHYISFYVLAAIPDNPLLGEKKSPWGLCLEVDDIELQPREIKLVELDNEYKLFFGRTWSLFKMAYIVKFDAHDGAGDYYIDEDTRSLKLHFTSVKREAMMCWGVTPQGTVVRTSQNHPNVLAYDLYNH